MAGRKWIDGSQKENKIERNFVIWYFNEICIQMMNKRPKLVPVKVECYAGSRADEYPRRFYWDDTLFEIREIVDRWYQGDTHPETPPADYFKVQSVSSGKFILKHELKVDAWFLVI